MPSTTKGQHQDNHPKEIAKATDNLSVVITNINNIDVSHISIHINQRYFQQQSPTDKVVHYPTFP